MSDAATLDFEEDTTAPSHTKPKEVVVHDHAPMAQADERREVTPLAMLDRAISKGLGMDVLQGLMDLQERHERNLGRRAFNEAIAAAKAELADIPIIKNRSGHNNKRYADFAAYAHVVDPIIGKHGLGYRFRTTQDDNRINVTCVLFHKDGHSEDNTLAGPADTSGSKNAIQAIGSTLTYLQRYSLVQALGLAASDDDDGVKGQATAGPISDDQVKELQRLIMDVDADLPKLLAYLRIERLEDIYADRFEDVKRIIESKRGKGKTS